MTYWSYVMNTYNKLYPLTRNASINCSTTAVQIKELYLQHQYKLSYTQHRKNEASCKRINTFWFYFYKVQKYAKLCIIFRIYIYMQLSSSSSSSKTMKKRHQLINSKHFLLAEKSQQQRLVLTCYLSDVKVFLLLLYQYLDVFDI